MFVYWRRKGSFLHLLKGNKKANKLRQEQTEVCQTKWTRLKIKGDKQNVVYISGARVSAVAQGPPYMLEDGGGGGVETRGRLHKPTSKSAFGDLMRADKAKEIQNKTAEVM